MTEITSKQRGYVRGIDSVRIELGAPVLITLDIECDADEAQAVLALANRAIRANKPIALALPDEVKAPAGGCWYGSDRYGWCQLDDGHDGPHECTPPRRTTGTKAR